MDIFTEKLAHAQTVCTRPFLLPLKGHGNEAIPILELVVLLRTIIEDLNNWNYMYKYKSNGSAPSLIIILILMIVHYYYLASSRGHSNVFIVMRPLLVAAPAPSQEEEGSGTAPLPELFCSPEILGNMNMQICGCCVTQAPYTYRTCSVY
jgi:hypothetical protein